jgi:NAD(P)-dependent dehydrogenase (short-subunit alcohol dehydrogenase family)
MHDVFDRFSLKNQVAVITGAGRGIGEGIAMDFARAGAKVALAARRTHEIEAVAERIIQEGGEAIAVTTDVTDPDALEALAVATKAAFGKLTIWVNNAGGSTMRQPMTTLPRDEWHRTIAVNLTSVYDGCMTAARHMEDGSIINISSGAGTGPVPGSGHYGAAKAGVNSLTWTLSAELAPRIRVNGVMPGAIPTEVMLKALNKSEDQLDELLEEWNIPLGRLGTPQDIGSACIFLASEASSWMSGEILRVGGGASPDSRPTGRALTQCRRRLCAPQLAQPV